MVSAYEQQPGQYTVTDWRRLDHQSDGPRFELINGRFVVKPIGTYLHRGVADAVCLLLHTALRQHSRGDLRSRTGLGVTLGSRNAILPDVAVVRRQPEDATALSAADLALAVDVIGPRTRKQDQAVTPAAYVAGWRCAPPLEGHVGPTSAADRAVPGVGRRRVRRAVRRACRWSGPGDCGAGAGLVGRRPVARRGRLDRGRRDRTVAGRRRGTPPGSLCPL